MPNPVQSPPPPTLVLDGQRYTCPSLSAAALSSKLHGPGPGPVDYDPTTTTWTLHGSLGAWQRVLGVPLLLVYADTRPTRREQLAALEHDRWARWMAYMFSRGTFHADGTWTMPAEKVARWQRQAQTAYTDLSEQEKESDRAEVDKTLQLLGLRNE